VREINEVRPAPVVLHVVKPEAPIPLDPDYFLGRIDAGTLIELGYRDACRTLDQLQPGGVAWQPEATQMRTAPPAILMRPTLGGRLITADRGDQPLVIQLAPEIPDAAALDGHREIDAPTTGHVTTAAIGDRVPFRAARTAVSAAGRLSFEATFVGPDGQLRLSGGAEIGSPDVRVVLHKGDSVVGEGHLMMDRRMWWSAVTTTHVTHAATAGDRWRAVGGFGRYALRRLRRMRHGRRR
jgi:hypothetical protein